MRARLRIAAAASLAMLAGIAASVGRVRAITPPAHAAASAEESSRILIDSVLVTVNDRESLPPVVTPSCKWSEATRSFSWLFP